MKAAVKYVSIWTSVIVAAVILVFTVGPRVETIFFPPFKNVNALLIASSENHVDLLITGTKVRTCTLNAAGAKVNNQGRYMPATATMLKQDGTKLEMQDQRLIAGAPFIRVVRVSPPGTEVKIDVDTSCHPFWSTRQVLVDVQLHKEQQ